MTVQRRSAFLRISLSNLVSTRAVRRRVAPGQLVPTEGRIRTGHGPGSRWALKPTGRLARRQHVSTEPNVSYVTGPVASRWGQPRLGKQNGRLRDCATPHVEVGEVREADLRQRGGGPEQSP